MDMLVMHHALCIVLRDHIGSRLLAISRSVTARTGARFRKVSIIGRLRMTPAKGHAEGYDGCRMFESKHVMHVSHAVTASACAVGIEEIVGGSGSSSCGRLESSAGSNHS